MIHSLIHLTNNREAAALNRPFNEVNTSYWIIYHSVTSTIHNRHVGWMKTTIKLSILPLWWEDEEKACFLYNKIKLQKHNKCRWDVNNNNLEA